MKVSDHMRKMPLRVKKAGRYRTSYRAVRRNIAKIIYRANKRSRR